MRINIFIIISVMVLGVIMGCSTANEITNPKGDNASITASGPQILGSFDFSWDEKSPTLDIVPTRDIEAHFNVTSYIYPKHIKLTIISWNPATRVLVVDATIDNPTNYDVYDVRGILTNMGAKKLLNADDYTKLFDKNTPRIANPFRAYAKDEPNRKLWGRYANPSQYTKTEQFEIYFPAEIAATFIITGCYPSNCPEPYDILNIEQTGTLYVSSGSIDVTLDALDWQDLTADHVIIEANPITVNEINMEQIDLATWSATITNAGSAPEGDYDLWVAAYDASFPFALYNKFTIHVNADQGWSWYDDFSTTSYIWTAYGGNWWGKYNGYMDATGGGDCYEEDTGSDMENPNVSYVSSPSINVPASDSNLILTINHIVDVDVPEELARFAWDMCYVRINGTEIFPTGGTLYEHNHYPWTFDDMFCWTGTYSLTESIFDLGTAYNGKTIKVEFVLDTYDYITNCKPDNQGWRIDDITLELE